MHEIPLWVVAIAAVACVASCFLILGVLIYAAHERAGVPDQMDNWAVVTGALLTTLLVSPILAVGWCLREVLARHYRRKKVAP